MSPRDAPAPRPSLRRRASHPRLAAVLTAAAALAPACAPPRTRGTLPAPREPLTATPDAPFRAAPPPAEPQPPFVAPRVQTFALANGIPVYLVERADPPVVAVHYVNRRAGEDDLRVEAGVPSLTTAMMREGTAPHPGAAFTDALGALGASLSAQTGRDASELALRAPAEHLAAAVALLAEAVRVPAFAQADFVAARNAQMDLRAGTVLSSQPLAYSMATELLFGPEHPYGRALTGLGPAIRARRLEQLVEYHRARFAPANSALVVVGATSPAELAAALGPTFGAWPSHGTAHEAPPAGVLPGLPAARVHIVDARRARQSHVLLAWRGPPRSTPDYATLLVLDRVLGGMFSSRLNLALRADRGYTYGARSRFALYREGGLLVARSNVATDETAAALARALDEVARLREQPVEAHELAAARALTRDTLLHALESAADTADLYADLVVHGLPADHHATLLAAVDAVTAADVQRAAQRYLAAREVLVVLVGDRDAIEGPVSALRLGGIEHYTFQR